MTASAQTALQDLLVDAFGRVRETLHADLEDLPEAALTWRPGTDANTIAWLVWHLTRVQDSHLTDLAHALGLGTAEQVWTAGGWYGRFGLPFPSEAHGYGQSSADVAAVDVPAADLLVYHDAVAARTDEMLRLLTPDHLSVVVDEGWDPPVTASVRLVSVVDDITQHAGQVAYVAGLWKRGEEAPR